MILKAVEWWYSAQLNTWPWSGGHEWAGLLQSFTFNIISAPKNVRTGEGEPGNEVTCAVL